MKDKEFLIFIHQRLLTVHKEDYDADYMSKLRCIINEYPEYKETPNTIEDIFCDKPLWSTDKCDKCLSTLEKDEQRQIERLVRYTKLFGQCECKEKCQ